MEIYFNEFLNNFEKSPKAISNGVLINNICNIYQNTKPTTKPDGSALDLDDRWYNTLTNEEAYWNGTYWLSLIPYIGNNNTGAATALLGANLSVVLPAPIFTGATFLEKILIYYAQTGGTLNGSNFYTCTFSEARNDGLAGTSLPGSFAINSAGTPNTLQGEILVNTLLSTFATPTMGILCNATITGSPGTVRFNPVFIYRKVF